MKKIKDPRELAKATVYSGWMAVTAAKDAKDGVWLASAGAYFNKVCLPLITEYDICFSEIFPISNNVPVRLKEYI